MAQRRRHHGRSGDRLRDRCDGCGVGRSSAGAGDVLVLHRSVAHAGLLGLLPIALVAVAETHVEKTIMNAARTAAGAAIAIFAVAGCLCVPKT
jgi:hypothetical protein